MPYPSLIIEKCPFVLDSINEELDEAISTALGKPGCDSLPVTLSMSFDQDGVHADGVLVSIALNYVDTDNDPATLGTIFLKGEHSLKLMSNYINSALEEYKRLNHE